MRSLAVLALLSACAPGVVAIEDGEQGRPVADPQVEVTADDDPWVIVADARLEDAGGDGVFSPGEPIVLPWTLVNVRAEDFMGYPGVVVETSDDRVVVEDFWLYGIFGRTTNGYASTVTSTAPSGTEVEFTVRSTTLGCEGGQACEYADEVRFTAVMP